MNTYELRTLLSALQDKEITIHTVSGTPFAGTIVPSPQEGFITLRSDGTTLHINAEHIEAIEFDADE